MALEDELDAAIRGAQQDIEALQQRLAELKTELARCLQVQGDALRLYRSVMGEAHSLDSGVDVPRERPRADMVLAVMEATDGPVTLSELVAAMPDGAERGAVSAVVHRAIARGEVRRLRRGLYELVGGRYARAG